MGVTSPFITAVTSPFITAVSSPLMLSKPPTPSLPLLDLVDSLSDGTDVEFCPPQLELVEEQKVQVHDELTIPVDGTDVEFCPPQIELVEEQKVQVHDELTTPVSNEVPAWPSHLPSYMDQAFVQNTFLELPRPMVAVSRRRAASDWSGILNLEESGFEVNIEDLQRPLSPILSGSADHEAANIQQSPKLSGDEQTCWTGLEDGADDWAGAQQCSASQQVPQLPVLVDGQEPYRPNWVYGSSWPFNHAPTTLILDNLPKSLMQVQLLAILDSNGFYGLYDFCFLPTNLRNGKNEGHAIVNFTRHSYGSSFAARIQGFQDWNTAHDEDKPCKVRWSLPLQGLVEHVQNYRDHPCMHESVPEAFRPMLFDCGWNVPFPCPTKPIRAPRMGQW